MIELLKRSSRWQTKKLRLAAHARTIWPVVRRFAVAPEAPSAVPWAVEISDPAVGSVRLTGQLRVVPGGSTLLVLVHGLGGSTDSTYMLRTARVADDLGLSTLRINLRGSDRQGEDLYHAGLSGDLHEVLASPALADFSSILLFGFSLGGHLSLRFATEVEDPRLRAVAAASAPLDLDRCVAGIDRPSGWIYRRYVLSGLCGMYAEVVARRELPLSVTEARKIRRIRDWDRRTIVPRFGFEDPEDYYRQASVAGRLGKLRVPALLVAAEEDPMVPRDAILEGLHGVPELLTLRWTSRGGHLAFAADLDLGEDAPRGLSGQVIGWLSRQ